jgi:hypothetical protein
VGDGFKLHPGIGSKGVVWLKYNFTVPWMGPWSCTASVFDACRQWEGMERQYGSSNTAMTLPLYTLHVTFYQESCCVIPRHTSTGHCTYMKFGVWYKIGDYNIVLLNSVRRRSNIATIVTHNFIEPTRYMIGHSKVAQANTVAPLQYESATVGN